MFFFPILCPHCLEKIFFFQQKDIYGVADSISEKINYHICPFILGKEYWKKKNLQLCFSLQQQKSLDLSSTLKQFQPTLYFKRTTKIPPTALLLSLKKKESYNQFYCCGFDFTSFFFISSQKKNWKIGSLLYINTKKILKDKKNVSQVIESKKKKFICLEKNNQHIFVVQLLGEDLNLLEKAEKMFLKQIGKKNKILSIYPEREKKKFKRIIIFIFYNSLEIFFKNLLLPQEVKFMLLEKDFQLQQKQLSSLYI